MSVRPSNGAGAGRERDRDAGLAALLERVAGGDREAFRELYELTRRRLFAVTLRITGSREVAEDVLQEAYVSIWTRSGDFDGEGGRVLGWMLTIARNRAIDRVRAGARRVRVDLDESRLSVPAPRSRDIDVHRCLEQLDAARRQALALAFYYGLTHEELSRHLDAPLGTVKSRVRRGLAQLKECLDG